MKICFITQNLYTLGGIQRVVTVLLNELVKTNKYDITVLMPFNMTGRKLFEINSAVKLKDLNEMYVSPKHTLGRYLLALNKRTGYLNFELCNTLVSRLKYSEKETKLLVDFLNQFDVVIGAGLDYSLLIAEIAPQLKCRTIGWQHSTYDAYFQRKGKAGFGLDVFSKSRFSRLDEVLVLTNSDKKMFDSGLGVNSKVYYNPISMPMNFKSNPCTSNVLFLGRLEKYHKGLEYLIQIIKRVSELKADASFVVVGDGPDRKWLEAELKDAGILSRVDVVGNSNDVYQYYATAKVLLQTSRWEGFGMTIVEAMSCGVPIVSFHNYGPDEIIREGIDGYLIDKFDIDTFSSYVVEILNNDELHKRLSINCLERAKDFDVKTLSKQFENFLGESND